MLTDSKLSHFSGYLIKMCEFAGTYTGVPRKRIACHSGVQICNWCQEKRQPPHHSKSINSNFYARFSLIPFVLLDGASCPPHHSKSINSNFYARSSLIPFVLLDGASCPPRHSKSINSNFYARFSLIPFVLLDGASCPPRHSKSINSNFYARFSLIPFVLLDGVSCPPRHSKSINSNFYARFSLIPFVLLDGVSCRPVAPHQTSRSGILWSVGQHEIVWYSVFYWNSVEISIKSHEGIKKFLFDSCVNVFEGVFNLNETFNRNKKNFKKLWKCFQYEGHFEIIDISCSNENERCIHHYLGFNYFKAFTVEVRFFFRPFKPRSEEGRRLNFRKKLQRRPYTMISQICESKLPFPVCFLSILRTGENSRWIEDWVEVREGIVEGRWCIEKNCRRQVRNGFEPTHVRMTHFQTLPTSSLYSVSFKMKLW